jgi:hypothetical protein
MKKKRGVVRALLLCGKKTLKNTKKSEKRAFLVKRGSREEGF